MLVLGSGLLAWPLPLLALTFGDQALGAAVVLVETLLQFSLGTWFAVATPLTGMLVAWMYGSMAGLSRNEQDILFIFGTLPPAVVNFIFAERYQQEPDKVASIVIIGNAAALLFIPLALALRL